MLIWEKFVTGFKIFSTFFEPFFLTALLGVFLAWRNAEGAGCKRSRFFWFLLLGSAWCLSWRLFLEITTFRYSAPLLFAVLVFCSYGCFRWVELPLFRKIPSGWLNAGVATGAALLILGAIARTVYLYSDPSGSTFRNLAEAVRTDAEKFAHPFVLDQNSRGVQLAFYSGVPLCFSASWGRKAELLPELLARKRYTGDALYFLVKEEGNSGPLESVGFPAGDLTRLGSGFADRRRHSRLTVYRFSPRDYSPALAGLAPEELAERFRAWQLPNGGFETLGTDGGLPDWKCGAPQFVFPEEKGTISGKRSLRLRGGTWQGATPGVPLRRQNCFLAFSVKGRRGSSVVCSLLRLNDKQNLQGTRVVGALELPDERTHLLLIPIFEQDLGDSPQFNVSIANHKGDFMIDDVTLIPASEVLK